jgi:hypothetical protein
MALKTPQKPLGTEFRASSRSSFVVNSDHPAVVERVSEHVPDREIFDTNPYIIESYLENGASTTTTITRTRGSAQ